MEGKMFHTFRQIQFENGSQIFLRSADHDRHITELLSEIACQKLVLHDVTVDIAAAWNFAYNLYLLPVQGSA
jgi:uncharacterized 2Fe-2S/4Fe-4S cluster protein (DUF4445 family)